MCPKLELLDHMVTLGLIFLSIHHSGCTILHYHQQYTDVPIFPHPVQHLLFSIFLDDSHPYGCEMESHCGFDLHFPND